MTAMQGAMLRAAASINTQSVVIRCCRQWPASETAAKGLNSGAVRALLKRSPMTAINRRGELWEKMSEGSALKIVQDVAMVE